MVYLPRSDRQLYSVSVFSTVLGDIPAPNPSATSPHTRRCCTSSLVGLTEASLSCCTLNSLSSSHCHGSLTYHRLCPQFLFTRPALSPHSLKTRTALFLFSLLPQLSNMRSQSTGPLEAPGLCLSASTIAVILILFNVCTHSLAVGMPCVVKGF